MDEVPGKYDWRAPLALAWIVLGFYAVGGALAHFVSDLVFPFWPLAGILAVILVVISAITTGNWRRGG